MTSSTAYVAPLEDIVERQESSSERHWGLCGYEFLRSEIVFLSQVIIIYVVVCLCLFNLTTDRGDSNLWSALLSRCLGYLLPNLTNKK